jgi:nucleotide-binding universal stress UspA family protein
MPALAGAVVTKVLPSDAVRPFAARLPRWDARPGSARISLPEGASPEGFEVMYDRIVVAVDHSEMSDRAVLAARDLAALSHGEVWVLHLREREIAVKTGAAFTDESADEAKDAVAAAVEVLAKAGVKAHGEVRTTLFGYAAREIVDDAIAHDADLIVMGSRGRSDLAGFILGSTAHKVIHLTDRPVLIIR